MHEVERRQQRELEPVFEAIRREIAAEYELPVEAIVLIKAGSIPKTSSGKIQRHACRQEFLDGTLESWPSGGLDRRRACRSRTAASRAGRAHGRAPATAASADRPERLPQPAPARRPPTSSCRRCGDVAKERAAGMTIDSSIVELGLDSLERMEIVAALEEQFGGRFPEEVLTQIETPREVAAAVDIYLGKRRGQAGSGRRQESRRPITGSTSSPKSSG